MPDKFVIDIPSSLTLPPEVHDQRLLRNAIAAVLYHEGKLSPRQAQELMGVSRREFEDYLGHLGFSMLDERDFQDEIDAAARFSRKQ